MLNPESSSIKSSATPLLSVVMPVHNPHQYLALCLDSVLQQSFHNFELIAIDDNSKDDSYSVLQEYANKDSRLIVMQNEKSLGAARTRNRGLYASRGEYIIFLDADDYFEPDYFENMIQAITSSKADLALCPIFLRNEHNGTEKIDPYNFFCFAELFKQPFGPSEHNSRIFYGMPYAPFNKMIRKQMLLEKKIEFQELSNSNDVYFGVIVPAESKRIVYLPKPYVHYRYNTGCQISTNRKKNPLCICYAYKKIRRELIARELWNKFSKMYNDTAVSAMFRVVSYDANEPYSMLEFIRGEGLDDLGMSNLQRKDFSSFRFYAKYKILFHGKRAVMWDISDIIKCLFKSLVRGEFSVFYWMLGHYSLATVRKCKNFLME